MKKYVAEVIGTFILVFCGTGAIIIDQLYGGAITHGGVAITFGLVVMALIYTFGNISGAHFNPVVSVAFYIAGRFPLRQVTPYLLGQFTGALLASFTLKVLFPTSGLLGATLPAGPEAQSLVMETLLTFFLLLVVLTVAHGSKEQGLLSGIAIGAVVALEALFAGPVCGASMNPVRSIAPALVSGHLEHLWIYIVGPFAGATVAVLAWKYLSNPEAVKET